MNWVSGAAPIYTLFTADGVKIKTVDLTWDMDLDELKKQLAQDGFELKRPVYEAPSKSQSETSFGGHTYELYNAPNFFHVVNSFAEAQSRGGRKGRLLTISCAAQNDHIKNFLIGQGVAEVWLGASDQQTEGEWKWLQGPLEDRIFWSGDQNGFAVTGLYSNWATGEPNNVNLEHCASMKSVSGQWNDVLCGDEIALPFIVEYGDEPLVCEQPAAHSDL